MRICFSLALLLALAACGGGKNDVDPRVIAGGGVADGAIDGVLNVHVIDGGTDDPIAGALVRVGEPGESPLEGMTDSSGLIRFEDGSLNGPSTVTVQATGYLATVWYGADGANVTIPIEAESDAAVPQAELSGSIDGWEADVPDAQSGHIVLGLVDYSKTTELGAPENELSPPPSSGQLPSNVCVKSQFGNQCDWSINARTGAVALTAPIVDVDTNGTPTDQSDDTATVIDFAYKLDHTVEDGVDQSGITLERLGAGGLADVELAFESPPGGLSESAAVLMIELGGAGLAIAGFVEGSADSLTAAAPDLAGPFADSSYRVVAFAQGATGEEGPSSAIILRGVTDTESAVSVGAWLPLPADLSESGGTYSFTPVEEAAFHGVDFFASGEKVWSVALLDGRTEFALPALDSPPPTPDEMQVNALDGPVDLEDFSIDEVFDLIERVSDQSADL